MDRKALCRYSWFVLPVACLLLPGGLAFGEPGTDSSEDSWRPPSVPHLFDAISRTPRTGGPNGPGSRDTRFPLFRMPTGYLINPVGLEQDDPALGDPNTAAAELFVDSSANDDIQVVLGADNPFFDFRAPGDPGGVGFYRLHAQYQLANYGTSCLCLALQAVTPAGLQEEGLGEGPTVLSPALAWYYELAEGTAVQGFVGKNMHANSRWVDTLESSVRYGVALQTPLPSTLVSTGQSMHMFIEALGHYHDEIYANRGLVPDLELLPGLHWQVSDGWWVSGGVIIPMSAPHPEIGTMQITCSWRF